MDLAELVPTLRRRWGIVLATLVAALFLAAAFVVVVPARYRATAELYVATATSNDPTALAQSNAYALARVQSYADLAGAPEVSGAVVQALGLPLSPAELAARVSVTAPLGKVLLDVTATDGTAAGAASIADETATRLADYIQKLEAKDGGPSPVRVTLIHPADVPAKPVFPPTVPLFLLAVVIGLGGGAVLAVLRSRLDTRIRSAADLADLGDRAPPLLAVVNADKAAVDHAVASDADPHGQRAEAYRQLRTTIDFLDLDAPPKVIAVTSPSREDGRTATALNLAVSLAASGERVCLIEADLRHPSLAGLVGVDPGRGLVEALLDDGSAWDFVQKVRKNLAVLVAGATPPNPNELLSTDRVRTLIAQVAASTDHVIIDTPPLLASSDGAEVASIADATLVVVRSGRTTRAELERSVATVERVGKQVSGAVLTMVKASQTTGGYRYVEYRPAAGSRSSTATSAATDPPSTRRSSASRSTGEQIGSPQASTAGPGPGSAEEEAATGGAGAS